MTKTTYFSLIFSLCLLSVINSLVFAEQPIEDIFEIEKRADKLSKEWNGESLRHSVLLYERAYNYWLNKNASNKASECLREIVRLKLKISQPNEALAELKKLKIIDKNNSVGKIENLSLESTIQLDLGETDRGEELLNQAQNLVRFSSDKNNQISVLHASAKFLFVKHENQKSIEAFEKAIILAKEVNSNKWLGQLNFELSIIYVILNEYKKSETCAEEALKNWQIVNDTRGIALTYAAFADIERFRGNKQKALNYLNQAKDFFPDDIDFYEKANLLNSFAFIYEDFNQYELSLYNRKKALEYFKKANHVSGQISTLLRLAELSLTLQDLPSMLIYLKEAEQLGNKLNDKYFLSIINADYGNYYLKINKTKSAVESYQKALKILDRDIYKRDISQISETLGEILILEKKFTEARRLFFISLELNSKIKSNAELAEALFKVAKLDLIENKTDDSLKNISESLSLTEKLYSNVANSNLKRSYFSNVYDRYELYINLLMQKHKETPNENFALQALQANEKVRSRSLLETLRLSESNFSKDANPELVQREKELLNLLSLKADKITELLINGTENGAIEKVDSERRLLENELEEIRANFKQYSPIYSAIKNPPLFDVTEFQQNVLDDKTVLLEFSLGEKESYLWLINKNEFSYFILPQQVVIESRIDKIRKTFDERQILSNEDIEIYRKRIQELEVSYNQEVKLLSNELLGQITDKIVDKRLIIVPDGKLHYLPLSILPFPNSNDLLISRNEIVYEPSASLLNILPKIPKRNVKAEKDLLIFADPVFSDTDDRLIAKNENSSSLSQFFGLNLRDFRLIDANGKIPRLFATQEEANTISGIVGKTNSEIASGFSANRERIFNSDISNYRILHFATHGLIDIERPEVSSIVLSQYDENGNKREGFLRLQDIYAMDLSSDLVVLSACKSGLGKEIKGEGLMSLNSAFLQAGAKSVLSSSWKVDDNATAEFMKRFYTNLIDKELTPSESLRQTQLEMLQFTQFKSPFYWGAFTLQGEFRQKIPLSTSYFYPILLSSLAFFGISIVLYIYRSKFYWMVKR